MSPEPPRRSPADMEREELDAIRSRANALEAVATDEFQRGVARAIRALAERQAHTLEETEHLKKAMDLLLEQVFRAQRGQRP